MSDGALMRFPGELPTLCVVATPMEAGAVLRGLGQSSAAPPDWSVARVREGAGAIDLVVSGVGKSNAAGATAHGLASTPGRYGLVMSLGIAGALPIAPAAHASRSAVGRCVVAMASVFADEGLASDEGFIDVAAMGFAPLPGSRCGVRCDARAVETLGPLADALGVIACVSTCSGADALAAAVAQRTGAIAEAMEGAAVGLVAARMGVAFVEARTISNTTGSRATQAWDIAGALARLSAFAAGL